MPDDKGRRVGVVATKGSERRQLVRQELPVAQERNAPSSLPEKASRRTQPVSSRYLQNAAMHYLAQRSASVAMLRTVLERRAKRRLGVRVLDAETADMIGSVIAKLSELGLVDDRRFAHVRTATLTARGLSKRHITAGLQAKGIGRELLNDIAAADIDDFAQARRTIERKRLGAKRRGGQTAQSHKKDLAALARAGFSYATAMAALKAVDDDN